MRRIVLAGVVAALAAVAAGCGGSGGGGTTVHAVKTPGRNPCSKSQLHLMHAAQLTVGTDNPAYPPWFGGSPGNGWKVSDPYSGKGYESAVVYALAKELNFPRNEVKWVYVPFAKSYAPGRKNYDFDINQISYTAERAKAVDFSDSYYDVNQAIVVHKGTPIANAKSIADLKPYTLGAEIGTTSYQFIKNTIKPKGIKVYNTNDLAVAALKANRIDGLVVDLPTAFYVTAVQVPNSEIAGQFANKTGEHFGMTFQKGNSLVTCVNKALATLRSNGTLKQINTRWLSKVVSVPVLK
jgi:polar amino acid transport system substrate-binding protein